MFSRVALRMGGGSSSALSAEPSAFLEIRNNYEEQELVMNGFKNKRLEILFYMPRKQQKKRLVHFYRFALFTFH